MAPPKLDDAELTKFGIVPADEARHPHSPAHEWWNESWFWDWYDASGELAGHCRVGLHPNQERGWIWFFLFNGSEWMALEEPRLPLQRFDPEQLSYSGWGLEWRYEAVDPLRSGLLHCQGFGRVVSGVRAGMILPMGAELRIEALGAPHSSGPGTVPGHSSETYSTNRFEQPIQLRGKLRFGNAEHDFAGRGERDHSWGPRAWNMEWIALVLNGEDFRMMSADVRIPNVPPFGTGYLHRETSQGLIEVDYRFAFNDDDITRPVAGPFSVKAQDGSVIAGRIDPISGAEIDITHSFDPPERSIYRRALVRFTPERGGATSLGWYESNRFVR
jgi:hypothetical protein